MIEEWKSIPGYEGLYEISSYGRVRSLERFYIRQNVIMVHKPEIILSPVKDGFGYLQVGLHCNGKQKIIKVHRLVAQAFIPNPDNFPQINHKDEDKTNNNVDNLEWCTAKYNINYGTRQERSINTKIKNGDVNEENVGLGREEYLKKYYQDHKDKICDIRRSYYQENKDRICEQHKEYRKKMIQNNV